MPRIEKLALSLMPHAVLLALGWLLLHSQGYYLVDDAYITFRYVSNLAQGQGLVWNPGDPVEGYTNLLWVLLLAPFALLGLDLTLPAAALGSLAACGCLDLLRRIASTVWPHRSVLIRSLPCLVLATSPSFAFWSTAGMETPLFAFWVLLSVHLLVKGRKDPRHRRRAGLTLAAAYLTRPEGLLVAAVLLAVEIAARRGPLLTRLRSLLVPGLVVAAVLAAHLGFRLWYYGDLLPNTFYAKVIMGWASVLRGLAHQGHFLVAGGYIMLPGIAVLLSRNKNETLRPYLVHGYLLAGAYLAYLIAIGGDIPRWYRFTVPLLPLPLLGLTELAAQLGEGLAHRLSTIRRWRHTWRGPVLAGVLLYGLCAPVGLCWNVAEPALSPKILRDGQINTFLYLFFFKKSVPDSSIVAATTVGMLAYYTKYRIIDAWGLNDRHIARVRVSPNLMFAHDKKDWIYVLGLRPDFIFTVRPRRKPMDILGYDLCWPTFLPLGITIYRRNIPLSEHQLSLGMPRGQQRTLIIPPKCKLKKK